LLQAAASSACVCSLPSTARWRSSSTFPWSAFQRVSSSRACWAPLYLLALPFLDLQKSQGPYYISISFVLLAYFESFVVLAGAYLAARPTGTTGLPSTNGSAPSS
jgi:hypothetical protein